MLELTLTLFLTIAANEHGEGALARCSAGRPEEIRTDHILPKSVEIRAWCDAELCDPAVFLNGSKIYSASDAPGLCFTQAGVFDYSDVPECQDVLIRSYLRVWRSEQFSDMVYFYTTGHGADVEDCYLEDEPGEMPYKYEIYTGEDIRVMVIKAD